MYWQVYFHPVSRSFEAMLTSLFCRLKQMARQDHPDLKRLPFLIPFLSDGPVSVQDHFLMDEPACNYGFNCLRMSEDPIASDLAGRLLDRRLFQDEALSEALDNAGFGIQLSAFKEPEKDTGTAETPPQSATHIHEVKQAGNPDAFNTTDEQRDVAFPVAEQVPAAETSHILQKLTGLDEKDSPTARPVMEEEAKPSSAGAETTPDAENTGLEAKYPDSMSVEEIMEQISVEEAKTVEVDFGTCRGWLLGQVMQSRPASLRYLVYAPTRASNLLKAAATVLLNELSRKMAS